MIALLWVNFGDECNISRGFPTAWPSHSPNINFCDFWLWEFIKDHVNRENVKSAPELKESILSHISSINRETLRATVEHVIHVNGIDVKICVSNSFY